MYEVPASKRSVGQDKFEFKIGSKTHKVTKAKYLTGAQLEDLTSGDLPLVFDVFGKRGTAIGDAVRSLDVEQILALVGAWVGDSDLSAGESKASSS